MRKIDRTLICYGAGRRMHARLGDTVRVAEDIISGADASDERWDDLLFMLNRLQVSLGEASVCDPKSANRYDDASAFIISSMKHRSCTRTPTFSAKYSRTFPTRFKGTE